MANRRGVDEVPTYTRLYCQKLRCRLVLDEARPAAIFLAGEMKRVMKHISQLGVTMHEINALQHKQAQGFPLSNKEAKIVKLDILRRWVACSAQRNSHCCRLCSREAKSNYDNVADFIAPPIDKVKYESALMVQQMMRMRWAKRKISDMSHGIKQRANIFLLQKLARRFVKRALKRKQARSDMLVKQIQFVIMIQRKFRAFGTCRVYDPLTFRLTFACAQPWTSY